jgi:hypothetical protein
MLDMMSTLLFMFNLNIFIIRRLKMRLCGIQTNALQNHAYQLVLPRFPLVEYFSNSFVLPQIALPNATVATPFTDLPIAGDKPVFAPMQFSFLVNEDMSNYEQIQEWIFSIGFADSYDSFTNYSNKGDRIEKLGEQDAKVIVLSSKGNPVRTITFYDAIPVALSGVNFTTQDAETSFVTASVTMAYSVYEFTS